MIESIMFFAGGFLVASLLGLILISFVHHRAVRLTRRRLQDAIPVSMAEIQADKDNLRAEFAMSARRLELSVEQLKAKATSQLGEIARKTEAINRLKVELAEKTAITDDLDARTKALTNRMRATEQDYESKLAVLEANERTLAAKEAELTAATAEFNEERLAAEARRAELAALKSQAEDFKAQIAELQRGAEDAARRFAEQRAAATAVGKELEEKRQALDTLRPQMAQLEREIATHTAELETRAERIDALEAHVREQDRLLTEGAATMNALRHQRELDVAAVHQQLAQNHADHRAVVERHQYEKTVLENNLADAKSTITGHANRIDDLIGRTRELERLLAEGGTAFEELRRLRERDVAAIREELGSSENRHRAFLDRASQEKLALENNLADARNMVASYGDRIDDLEQRLADRERLIGQRDSEIRSHLDALAFERQTHEGDVERLENDKQSLDRLLQTANNTLDTRGERIEHIEARLAEREELLRQCEAEIKSQVKEIASLKNSAAATSTRSKEDVERLEGLLRTSVEERRLAQQELAAIKLEAEQTWKTERVESALLRERINDIAAQVAQMALSMDKSGSIATLLTQAPRAEVHEFEANGEDPTSSPAGDLTQRIRKLQGTLSRASTAS